MVSHGTQTPVSGVEVLDSSHHLTLMWTSWLRILPWKTVSTVTPVSYGFQCITFVSYCTNCINSARGQPERVLIVLFV